MVVPYAKRGLYDWLVQRVSAVLILSYVVGLSVYWCCYQPASFADWQLLFRSPWFQWTTLWVVIFIAWHAWIGLWTVSTDYMKCAVIRLAFQIIVVALLLFYIIWTVLILWK